MSEPAKIVLLPVPLLLLELHSERCVDAMKALEERGFKVTSIINTNRYRIEDEEELK